MTTEMKIMSLLLAAALVLVIIALAWQPWGMARSFPAWVSPHTTAESVVNALEAEGAITKLQADAVRKRLEHPPEVAWRSREQ